MIKKLLYTLSAAALLLTSCDEIDENERLIYVPPVQTSRSILVEEFSGQLCVNCPDGSAVLEALQEQYSADTVIVVSFHVDRSVNKGIPSDWTSLTTEEGGKLFDDYKCNSMPVAVFDRKSGTVDAYYLWNTYTSVVLQMPTTLALTVNTQYSEKDNGLDISVSASQSAEATAALSGNIHVWLTEDSVVAPQKLSNGNEMDHVFHNIFRTSVNDMAGDAITVGTNNATTRTFHTTLDPSWRADKMNVVVFVDNDSGVQQTARAKVTE